MRLAVIGNDPRRLHLVLRTHVALYAVFGLMFAGLGVVCLWLLGPQLAGVLLGLVCIGAGLVILAAIQRVDLLADRSTGRLVIERHMALWRGAKRMELAIADIERVLVVASTLDTGRHITTSYSVKLRTGGLAAGEVALTFLPMFTEKDALALARLIEGWLARG